MYSGRVQTSLLAATGLARRELFAHDVLCVAKPYPDSQLLLERRGISRRGQERGQFIQLNLYSLDLFDLPTELFTDPEVNWHGQQFGRPGLIAAAGLFLEGSRAIVITLQSDLCQQLYRHHDLKTACKTRVETHFGQWHVLLLNAVLDFCLATGIAELYSPTGHTVVGGTKKAISPALFLRIYDEPAVRYRCEKAEIGRAQYWKLPVSANAARVARLAPVARKAVAPTRPVIAIFHDIEENVDTPVSLAECQEHLAAMLEIESKSGVAATYSLLGNLMSAKRKQILASNARHSIGFHSYDHDTGSRDHLERCREVDLRVRGYRPPRSQITPEISDSRLTYFNFEWLASSASSLGLAGCRLENGLVKIPIHLDDYSLHTGALDYGSWEAQLLASLRSRSFFAFGLHDCYGANWLPHYPALLEKLGKIGTFVTADEICKTVFLNGDDLPWADAALRPPVGVLGRLARLFGG